MSSESEDALVESGELFQGNPFEDSTKTTTEGSGKKRKTRRSMNNDNPFPNPKRSDLKIEAPPQIRNPKVTKSVPMPLHLSLQQLKPNQPPLPRPPSAKMLVVSIFGRSAYPFPTLPCRLPRIMRNPLQHRNQLYRKILRPKRNGLRYMSPSQQKLAGSGFLW